MASIGNIQATRSAAAGGHQQLLVHLLDFMLYQ